LSCSELQLLANTHRPVSDGVVLVLALGCFVLAYRWRGRPERAGLAIAAGAAILGLGFSLDAFLHRWDERFHALVGKNLLGHLTVPTLYDDPVLPAPITWGTSHVWLHKPPLTLYAIAASLWAFGTCELAVRIPSVVLFAVATYAVSRIGLRLFSARVGLIAGFLYAVNGQLLDLASGRRPTDHPESLFASLVCVAVWLALRQVERGGGVWRAAAVGLAVGLAVLTKFLPALVVFPVWLVYVWRRPRPLRAWLTEMTVALVVCVAVALPWHLYTRAAFPAEVAYESEHARAHLLEPLDGHVGPFWYHLIRVPPFFGELSPLAVIWFVVTLRRLASLEERRSRWTVLTWFALVYGFFTLVPTRMPNYVMLSAPAVMLMVATFTDRLLSLLQTGALAGARRKAAWAAVALLLILPVRFMLERYKPFRRWEKETEQAMKLRRLGTSLASEEKVVLFNASSPFDAMFYTGRTAYPSPPTDEERRQCEARGYRVIVLE
jgi:4-amino-4-deoxy-L-arabinose transferase